MSWVSAVLAGALVLACAFGWYEHAENVRLNAALVTYKANERTLIDSNASKDAANADLQASLDKVTGQKQQVELARDLALAAQADSRDKLKAAAAREKSLRSMIYAKDIESRRWAFSPVPDALGRQLCDQWASAGGDPGPGCRSEGAAVRGDPSGAHDAAAAGSAPAAGVLPADCGAGCFSNDQLRSALDSALSWGGQCVAQLRAIGALNAKAVEATSP
jgi:hypothetical protein